MCLRLLSLLAAISGLAAQAAAPSLWEWVAPIPHRQGWVDLTVGPAGFVGLTDGFGGRQIYRSADGESWQQAQPPANAGLRKIAYLNGSYIAIGNQEMILSSPDGLDWQVRHSNAMGAPLFDIAYGNGVYIAVGYNSVAYFSKDLKVWSGLDFPKGYSLLNVAFGNGLFLAVANSGLVYHSVDGRAWTPVAWPTLLGSASWSSYDAALAFSGGQFALSVPGGSATTPDGVNWRVNSQTFCRKLIAVDGGLLGAVGNTLAFSSDAASWQSVATMTDSYGQFTGGASLNGKWLAVGSAGALYSSPNGSNWQSVLKPIDYSHGDVAFANGAFIRFGSEAGQFISTDGKTWTFNAGAPALDSLAGGNGIWVGISPADNASISTDTQNWTDVPLPARPSGGLLFANSSFLVGTEGGVLISADGKSWDLISIPNIKSVRLVGYQNGVFAAVSGASEPLTSADGRAWTVHPAQANVGAQFYSAGNGRFVGIGGGGMGPGSVTWSTDGATWQRQMLDSGSTYPYTGLSFGGGYFVMTDTYGGIFYSQDGIVWTGERQAPQPFTNVAYGEGVWVALAGDSILRSNSRLAAKSAATLQLTRTDSTWSLVVAGSAGEKWQIESSANVGAPWEPVQIVEIPILGKATVPLSAGQSSAFFRASIQP
jgi:hypothetical protein